MASANHHEIMNVTTVIKTLVLPKGELPFQGRNGDIGFDACVRAIVSPKMDSQIPYMRQTLWNFQDSPSEKIANNAQNVDGKWEYMLQPNEGICLGLGVVFGGNSMDWYAELAPRSSISLLRLGIKNYLEGVPIDPNFRSEPVLFIANHSALPFGIFHGIKLTQFKFFCACCRGQGFLRPILLPVCSFEELGQTNRGHACHGSSDLLRQKEFDLGDPYLNLSIR